MKKILLALVMMGFISALVACGSKAPDNRVELPNLEGKTVEEAEALLSSLLLSVVSQTEESEVIEPGIFVRYGNSLAPGEKLARGSVVYLYFARAVETGPVPEVNMGIMISKYLESNTFPYANRAIEIFNASNTRVELDGYFLEFFNNGSFEVSNSLELQGTLLPRSTHVVTYTDDMVMPALFAKANQVSDQLTFNGNDVVRLRFDDIVLDQMGVMGIASDFAKNVTLVRKQHITQGSTQWDAKEWVPYRVDFVEALGNHPRQLNVSPIADYNGPTINPEHYERDFLGARGGIITVTLGRCADGDTAIFNFPQSVVSRWPNITSNYDRVRFLSVDTPEVDGPNTNQEPWGKPASIFTCDVLTNASIIQLQSDPGSSQSETFGRTLAWVWADGKLVNYMTTERGLSDARTVPSFPTNIFSDNITLYNWVELAGHHAMINQLGVYGELDPFWDYENNQPLP